MKRRFVFVKDRFTKCDSGKTLNWLMHPFLFMTLVFGIGFLFFDHTAAVQESVLYRQTLRIDNSYINLWGVVALSAMALHTVAFLVRGKWGVQMMRAAIFGGFYLWLWASIIYLKDAYVFQFFIICVPNLYFWGWYALEWAKRKRGEEVAFV